MKFMKWKIFIQTSVVCLLPILFGVAIWEKLPETMAIHFNVYNQPDGFASKGFVVFGMPVLMMLLQLFCCFVNDINTKKHGERVKFTRVTKWIIPVMTVVLQVITLGLGLGWSIDVRKAAASIVGVMFLVLGNYLPKFDYIKNHDISSEKARRINRVIGFETVALGLLFLISIFLPPVFTVCCLFLLIPYAIAGIIYGIKTGRK